VFNYFLEKLFLDFSIFSSEVPENPGNFAISK
jgi:hypothetical protein